MCVSRLLLYVYLTDSHVQDLSHVCESRFGALGEWIGIATLRSLVGDNVVGEAWREESVAGKSDHLLKNENNLFLKQSSLGACSGFDSWLSKSRSIHPHLRTCFRSSSTFSSEVRWSSRKAKKRARIAKKMEPSRCTYWASTALHVCRVSLDHYFRSHTVSSLRPIVSSSRHTSSPPYGRNRYASSHSYEDQGRFDRAGLGYRWKCDTRRN